MALTLVRCVAFSFQGKQTGKRINETPTNVKAGVVCILATNQAVFNQEYCVLTDHLKMLSAFLFRTLATSRLMAFGYLHAFDNDFCADTHCPRIVLSKILTEQITQEEHCSQMFETFMCAVNVL